MRLKTNVTIYIAPSYIYTSVVRIIAAVCELALAVYWRCRCIGAVSVLVLSVYCVMALPVTC